MKKRVFSIILMMLLSVLLLNQIKIKAAVPEDINFSAALELKWHDISDGSEGETTWGYGSDEVDGFYKSISEIAEFSVSATMGQIPAYNSKNVIYPGHETPFLYWVFNADMLNLAFYNFKFQWMDSINFENLVNITTTDILEASDDEFAIYYWVDNEIYHFDLVERGTQLVFPEDPEKENYVFVGWYSDPLFYYAYDPNAIVVNGFNLYSKFVLEELNVNFYNGYTLYSSKTVMYGGNVNVPLNPINVDYDEIIYNVDYSKSLMEIFPSQNQFKLNDVVWKYSNFSPDLEVFKFERSDSSQIISETSFSSIKKIIITGNSTNNSLDAFLKLSISEDKINWTELGMIFFNNLSLTERVVNNNKNIKKDLYIKINGQNNGAQAVITNIVVLTNHNFETEKKYIFDGWFYDQELTIPYKETDVFTSDTNLYSSWKEVKYELSFDSNGGSPVTSQYYYEEGPIILPEYNPTRLGYVFDGWYVDQSLETEFTLETMPDVDITLYAKWEETTTVQYLIEFYLDQDLYTYIVIEENAQLILPATPEPEEGYLFLGWYYDENFETKFKVSDPIEDDLVLYGKFGIDSGGSGNELPSEPPESPAIEFNKKYLLYGILGAVGLFLIIGLFKQPKKSKKRK